jgi:hypothetical protein
VRQFKLFIKDDIMSEGEVVFNGNVIYSTTNERLYEHDHFMAYQRLSAGTGTVEDLHTCVQPTWKEIFDAANSEPNPITVGQLLRKYPNQILSNARPKLSRNITSTEEKIFTAKMHGDMFYEDLKHLCDVIKKVYNACQQGSSIKNLYEASPRHIGAIKTKFLWRGEKFNQALTDLNIENDVPKLIDGMKREFDLIEMAYNTLANSPAVGQVC